MLASPFFWYVVAGVAGICAVVVGLVAYLWPRPPKEAPAGDTEEREDEGSDDEKPSPPTIQTFDIVDMWTAQKAFDQHRGRTWSRSTERKYRTWHSRSYLAIQAVLILASCALFFAIGSGLRWTDVPRGLGLAAIFEVLRLAVVLTLRDKRAMHRRESDEVTGTAAGDDHDG